MSSEIERFNERMLRKLPKTIKPKKVLCVRERNVDFGLGKIGVLKPVMAKRFIKNCYTHIQLRGAVHESSISTGFNTLIVWIEPLK